MISRCLVRGLEVGHLHAGRASVEDASEVVVEILRHASHAARSGITSRVRSCEQAMKSDRPTVPR
jgi:hypothetical protein